MRKNGFSIIEVTVAVAFIGILAAVATRTINTVNETRVVACVDELWSMETLVEQAWEQTRPFTPTWEEVQQIAGNRWDPHFHYLPNNTDHNKGHGNDLDLCDEENPGRSLDQRTCLDILWVIVCDHDHQDLVMYNFAVGQDRVYSVATNTPKRWKRPYVPDEPAFLHDLTFWEAADPNLRKWIGR